MKRLPMETLESIIGIQKTTLEALEKQIPKKTYNPCDDCQYSYSKQNQESGICEVCEFKMYRDAEEQGLLLRLPCKVGDTIYRINQYAKEPIIPMRVSKIIFKESYSGYSGIRIDAINVEDFGESCYFLIDIGKTVFLTKEEAEQALERMEKEK